jgi:hypothetical protein
MSDLIDILDRLPPVARNELIDFAKFLDRKYSGSGAWPEQSDWKAMTEASSTKFWDNPEDDVYASLL